MTSSKAILLSITTVTLALVGLLVAAGLHIRPEFRDAIVNFETAVVPVAILVYGWLHHSHTKVVAARLISGTPAGDANKAAGRV